jgi:hypothetical protein
MADQGGARGPFSRHHEEAALAAGFHQYVNRQAPHRLYLRSGVVGDAPQNGEQGPLRTAKRLRSTCSQIFRYAIATARAERDVAADLRGALIAPKPVHRAAITSPTEAGGLLRAR